MGILWLYAQQDLFIHRRFEPEYLVRWQFLPVLDPAGILKTGAITDSQHDMRRLVVCVELRGSWYWLDRRRPDLVIETGCTRHLPSHLGTQATHLVEDALRGCSRADQDVVTVHLELGIG